VSARRLPLVALLALLGGLAACNKTSARPGLRLNGPSAVAVFSGLTGRDPAALRPYLAVANERGDDLRILDATDGKAVLAPGLVMSLSVPTAPRPALLAAGSLADAGGAQADLLLVAPAGLAACDPAAPLRLVGCIQVVATWTPATALDPQLTLVVDDLAGGQDGELLSMVVLPVPEDDGAGGFRPAAGRVRVAAGLSGGRLLLADWARAGDGVSIALVAAAVHDLGFDAVALSAAPAPDLNHLYAASPDPIAGVEGVAELDVRGAVDQAPTVRAIRVDAPTSAVLVAKVRPFVALNEPTPKLDQFGPEVTRLYAAIDPNRGGADGPITCGRERPITCGLVVLDPSTGLPVPDPAGQLPSHAPISVPGTILGIAAIYPPSVGGILDDGTTAPDGSLGVLQKQATAAGERFTSTLAAVTTTTGSVVLVDLARGALALDRGVLATATGASPARIATAISTIPTVTTAPRLGLWDGRATPAPAVLTTDAAALLHLVTMTPGYTPSDSWAVLWEGPLPDLVSLPGQVQARADHTGLEWVAIQSSSGLTPEAGPFRGVGRLYDPRLLVRPGDIVEVTPDDEVACPLGKFELEVTAILAPTADHLGGAVSVVPRPAALQPTVTEGTSVVPADPACLDAGGRSTARVTFRAGGLILNGTAFGYGGRPQAQASAAGPGFSLAWADPAALTCPQLDDPTWPPATTCDQGCRDTCEQLLLSRKARRLFYMAEVCFLGDTACVERWGSSPLVDPTGPVVAFKAGWVYPAGSSGTERPVRGSVLTFGTASGQAASVRRPISGGQPLGAVLPGGMATFDRAGYTGLATDGVRVFTAYTGNLVLDFSPSQSAAAATVHR
jgi:hypothetical protein